MMVAWRADGPADAPALVLLNALGGTKEMWTPCLAPLIEQFSVVRIDARGHGDSAPSPAGTPCMLADLAADVLDVLDELGLEQVNLAGVSLGGMLGCGWRFTARSEPDGSRCCPPPRICHRVGLDGPRRDGSRAGDGAIADESPRVWITAALAARDPELASSLRAMLAGVDAESYAQCCGAIAEMDLRRDLGRIAAPTLVVAAVSDSATPPEHARLIADGVAGARLEILEAAHTWRRSSSRDASRRCCSPISAVARRSPRASPPGARSSATTMSIRIAARTELSAAFQDFLTRYAWGDVWSRPGLSRRDRSIVTLAALVTLGAENELVMHVRAALRNGLSADEISEILLHTALYAGLPRANRAFAIARDALAEILIETQGFTAG